MTCRKAVKGALCVTAGIAILMIAREMPSLVRYLKMKRM
ncbi:MAG: DUF6893 family small protein [Myxococcales bacterium]|jgi:hypothetical protein